jgi:hypothetical protein
MDHTRIDSVPPTAQRLIKKKASILATDWKFGYARNVQSEQQRVRVARTTCKLTNLTKTKTGNGHEYVVNLCISQSP